MVRLCSGKLSLAILIELTLDLIRSTRVCNDFGSRRYSQAETYKALVGTSSAVELLETTVEVYETSNCQHCEQNAREICESFPYLFSSNRDKETLSYQKG
jgi:hypothetical protein